jgi:hypothetical protein
MKYQQTDEIRKEVDRYFYMGSFRPGSDANMNLGSGYPVTYFGELFAVIQIFGGDLVVKDIHGNLAHPETVGEVLIALESAYNLCFAP